jgi:rod shape-determining protein MreD
MGRLLSIPLLALAAIISATFLPQIRIFNGQPDLIFLFVIGWALNAPLEEGVVWAFVGGICKDLFSAAPLGSSVVGLVLLVFAIEWLRDQFAGLGLPALLLLVVGGTFLVHTTWLLIFALSGFPVRPVEFFTYTVLPTLGYNLLLALPAYWVIRRLQRRAAPPARFFRE